MDRLTAQYGENQAVPTKFDLDFVFRVDKDIWDGLTNIFDRLDAYEKTGLMPDEIPQLKSEVERLTAENKKLHEISAQNYGDRYLEMQEKNATLKKALEMTLKDWPECHICIDRSLCNKGISCFDCRIQQAQQLTHETHGEAEK